MKENPGGHFSWLYVYTKIKMCLVFFCFWLLLFLPIILFCLSLPNTSNGILISHKKNNNNKKIRARCWSLRQSLMGYYAFWWYALFYFPHAPPRAVCESRSPFFWAVFPPLVCDAIVCFAVHDRNRNIAQFSFFILLFLSSFWYNKCSFLLLLLLLRRQFGFYLWLKVFLLRVIPFSFLALCVSV